MRKPAGFFVRVRQHSAAFETGADDYLGKPLDGEEILARIESLNEIRRRLRRKFSEEVLLGPDQIPAAG